PIFEAFYQEEDRASLLRGMNLSPELPTVLIMAGSFGVKNILRVYCDISTLGTAFQVIVITGKNKTLYEAFQKELPNSSKPTHLVEFTTEVQKYMHASDLLITKPGGLTVSEALASAPMASSRDPGPGGGQRPVFAGARDGRPSQERGELCVYGAVPLAGPAPLGGYARRVQNVR
ncbi:MAG: glycosyltransferase, partial [Anaeromassilibacillus sp.]